MKLILCLLLAMTSSLGFADDIQTLAQHYRELRAKQNALPQGVFDAELSGAGGQLDNVLHELGEKLAKQHYTESEVTRLMGEPDAIKQAGEYQPPSIGERHETVVPKNSRYLIYFWRGWHDYLYFVSTNGKITAAYWYYAGE